VITSSRKSYNHLALRGLQVEDDEFINDWNSNPLTKTKLTEDLAFTMNLMPAVMDIGIDEDLQKGLLDNKGAQKRKHDQMKEYRELLAKQGMLK